VSIQLPTTGIDVVSLARRLLAYTSEFFATAGIALPSRQYIAPGTPSTVAWDCEQLVVTLAALNFGKGQAALNYNTTVGPSAGDEMRNASFGVQLVRCTPGFEEPTEGLLGQGWLPEVDEINTSGEQMLIDAGTLSQALSNLAAKADPQFTAATGGTLVQAGAVTSFGPAGCLWGITGSLTVTAGVLLP